MQVVCHQGINYQTLSAQNVFNFETPANLCRIEVKLYWNFRMFSVFRPRFAAAAFVRIEILECRSVIIALQGSMKFECSFRTRTVFLD